MARSSRKLRAHVEAEVGELTIIPYLDILMNLILFMLLSMTGLGVMRVLKASSQTPGSGLAKGAPVTVLVDASGYVVTTDDTTVSLPKIDERWPLAELTAALTIVKASRTGDRRLVLRASPGLGFEDLVATMDAAREGPARQPLFPDVTLASEGEAPGEAQLGKEARPGAHRPAP
jgi:biopolymer transport protein ExbD